MESVNYNERIRVYLEKQFNLPEAQVLSMLPAFVDTLSSHMQRLEDALQENNLINIARAAHTIKGALLNLGLSEFAESALQIELGARNFDDTLDYPELIASLRQMVNTLANE